MSKTITIIGGNGYVGSRCIKTLLSHVKDIKIYSIARSFELHNLNKYDERVEYIKGDALNPDNLSPFLEKSTGVIHTVGQLISTSKNEDTSYEKVNYQSAIKVARIVENLSTNLKTKKNFVFISAERGFAFPLSLAFSGYIEYKRKAEEELIKEYKNINPVILRPGLINDTYERPYLIPLALAFDTIHFLEKNVLNKISPNIGECANLPASSIYLDTLAFYAAAGALGKLNLKVYSNDFMNNLQNMSDIKLE